MLAVHPLLLPPALPPSTSSRTVQCVHPFFAHAPLEQTTFQPRQTLLETLGTGTIFAGFGVLMSVTKHASGKYDKGPSTFVNRTGRIALSHAVNGATYAFGKSTAANYRETNDLWNDAAGACAIGTLEAARLKSFPLVLVSGIAYGIVVVFSNAIGEFTGSLSHR